MLWEAPTELERSKCECGIFGFADSCSRSLCSQDVFMLAVIQQMLFLDWSACGLLSGDMKRKRRPVGTRCLKAKFEVRDGELSKSAIFRVLWKCALMFDLMC